MLFKARNFQYDQNYGGIFIEMQKKVGKNGKIVMFTAASGHQ
jgi:hypothetical protein